MRRKTITLGLAVLSLAGCGEAAPRSTAPPATPPDRKLETTGGRIVVRGDFSPFEAGPLKLEGRYRAVFTQRGRDVDFSAEVPFTAHLEQERPGGGRPREVALFAQAARTGSATVTARGRWTLLVDFGDSPFEITLTPQPGG